MVNDHVPGLGSPALTSLTPAPSSVMPPVPPPSSQTPPISSSRRHLQPLLPPRGREANLQEGRVVVAARLVDRLVVLLRSLAECSSGESGWEEGERERAALLRSHHSLDCSTLLATTAEPHRGLLSPPSNFYTPPHPPSNSPSPRQNNSTLLGQQAVGSEVSGLHLLLHSLGTTSS